MSNKHNKYLSEKGINNRLGIAILVVSMGFVMWGASSLNFAPIIETINHTKLIIIDVFNSIVRLLSATQI